LNIFKACRGTEFDDGTELNVADAKGEMEVDPKISIHKIPAEADFLVAYSVVPGMKSDLGGKSGFFVLPINNVKLLCLDQFLHYHTSEVHHIWSTH
jgi:hypothetical protein